MNIIDLFSGAGGLTEGFLREGFDFAVHIEKDRWACETLKTRLIYYYLKEHNDLNTYITYLHNANYRNIDRNRRIIYDRYPMLEEKVNTEVLNIAFGEIDFESIITSINNSMIYNNMEEIDVIIGGPPCQTFSLVGRGRMGDNTLTDNRTYLFQYYKRIVERYRPKVFVFENVPGILSMSGGAIFRQIREEFREIGYNFYSGTDDIDRNNYLNSKDFGVNQVRKRMILLGVNQEYDITYPNFLDYRIDINEDQTTRNTISDLPIIQPNEGNDFYFGNYTSEANSYYQQLLRNEDIGVLNHKARRIRDLDRQIYEIAIQLAQDGQRLRYTNLPGRLRTHNNTGSFLDRFKVHWWDDCPHTVVAHIAKDGHYNIHPDINQLRALTVREAARIQSFPDDYFFEGPRTFQYTQVGNAVPPLMSQAIARGITDLLDI